MRDLQYQYSIVGPIINDKVDSYTAITNDTINRLVYITNYSDKSVLDINIH